MFGTALCIVFTIILIKRNHRTTDEDNSHVTQSRDTVLNNGACALERISSLISLGNINKGCDDDVMTQTNSPNGKQHSCNHGDVTQSHQCNNTMTKNYDQSGQRSDRRHDDSRHNNGYNLRSNSDAVILMEGRYASRQDRLSPPLQETNTRKLSDSESILTTAKVIYVRDSSSSRSSSSSSNEQ